MHELRTYNMNEKFSCKTEVLKSSQTELLEEFNLPNKKSAKP